MDVKLPKDKTGLLIKHLLAVADQRLNEKVATIGLKIDTLRIFTGQSKARLHTWDLDDVDHAFTHLLAIIATIDIVSPLPHELMINDQLFVLVDPEKAPSGWHADYAESDFSVDPVRLACMCYIPHGTFYGQIDQHENLMYPIRSRHELFTDHFPLETYIRLTAFFLLKFGISMNAYMAQQKKKERKAKWSRRINGYGMRFLMPWRKNTL